MAKNNLIELMTGEGRSPSDAADQLDRTVENILRRLRKGESVALPGLGRIVPKQGHLRFIKSSVQSGAARGRK